MGSEGGGAGVSLREIIRELLGRQPGQVRIKPGYRLREDLGFDSVLIVDLMVEIELRLGVRFDPLDDDLAAIFATFGSLEEFVAGGTGAR